VDIGAGSVYAAQFRPAGRGLALQGLLHRPVTGADTMTSDGSLLDALLALRASPLFRSRRVLAHLPPQLLSGFPIRAHPARSETVEAAILRETRKYLSFPADEALLDWPSLSRARDDEGGGYKASVVALRRADLHRYLEVFRAAGLTLEVVDANVASLLRLHQRVRRDGPGRLMLCNLGAQESLIAVADDDGIVAHRTIPWGVEPLIKLLLEHLKALSDARQARELLSLEGLSYDERGETAFDRAEGEPAQARVRRALHQIVGPPLDQLMHELHELIAYVRAESRAFSLGRIELFGHACLIRNLDRFLERRMGTPVELVNPAERLDLNVDRLGVELRDAAEYSLAMGLALRSVPWL
jgi:type IV pilus assembly protein PilM